jgi:hypothetical protein
MVKYEIFIQPVRVQCTAFVPGRVYVLAYERKSVEFATHPQTCSAENSVSFCRPTDPLVVTPFVLPFESRKDKRNLRVSLFDFTSRKSVSSVGDFECSLGGYCDVTSQQSINEVKSVAFQFGKHTGTFEFILCMHPLGTPIPPGNPLQGQKASRSAIPPSLLAILIQEGLLPVQCTSTEMDADIAEEIIVQLRKLNDRSNPKALMRLRDDLISEVHEMSERVSSSANASTKALLLEAKKWEGFVEEYLRRMEPQKDSILKKDDLAADIEGQIGQLNGQLRLLEAEQVRRDVTNDVCALLEKVHHLEGVLAEIKKTEDPSVGSKGAVKFTEDVDEQYLRLANSLFDELSAAEERHCRRRILDELQRNPYLGFDKTAAKDAYLPNRLEFTKNSQWKPLETLASAAPVLPALDAHTKAVTPISSTGKGDVLEDLFGGIAPAASLPPATRAEPTYVKLPLPSTPSTTFIGLSLITVSAVPVKLDYGGPRRGTELSFYNNSNSSTVLIHDVQVWEEDFFASSEDGFMIKSEFWPSPPLHLNRAELIMVLLALPAHYSLSNAALLQLRVIVSIDHGDRATFKTRISL